jgi:hypothetical protein
MQQRAENRANEKTDISRLQVASKFRAWKGTLCREEQQGY